MSEKKYVRVAATEIVESGLMIEFMVSRFSPFAPCIHQGQYPDSRKW